jgi:hypothetical protein
LIVGAGDADVRLIYFGGHHASKRRPEATILDPIMTFSYLQDHVIPNTKARTSTELYCTTPSFDIVPGRAGGTDALADEPSKIDEDLRKIEYPRRGLRTVKTPRPVATGDGGIFLMLELVWRRRI